MRTLRLIDPCPCGSGRPFGQCHGVQGAALLRDERNLAVMDVLTNLSAVDLSMLFSGGPMAAVQMTAQRSRDWPALQQQMRWLAGRLPLLKFAWNHTLPTWRDGSAMQVMLQHAAPDGDVSGTITLSQMAQRVVAQVPELDQAVTATEGHYLRQEIGAGRVPEAGLQEWLGLLQEWGHMVLMIYPDQVKPVNLLDPRKVLLVAIPAEAVTLNGQVVGA